MPVELVPVEHDPFAVPPGANLMDAFEAAAARTRQSVQPDGGRQEGGLTRLADRLVPAMAQSIATLPQRAFEASENRRLGGTYDAGPVTDAALMTMGTSMPFAQPGAAGVFGGRLAATADHAALAKAEQMAATGADRTAIWNDTGWFQGADGKWRFEIPDDRAGVWGMTPDRAASSTQTSQELGSAIVRTEDRGLRIKDIVQHPDLYEAYPLADNLASTYPMPLGQRGTYDRPFGILSVDSRLDPWDARSTALHEIQHAVQQREGFAQGGSPEMFRREHDMLNKQVDEINEKMRAASRAGDTKTYHELMDERSALVPRILTIQGKYGLIGDEPYRNLAGEVEARNVQYRKDMTPEQRRATPPWETEDVPRELQDTQSRSTGPQASIRAYHGSPYDFDRFDLSKIGTGEGAQAYGHGLYFAENPATAADYKTRLSGPFSRVVDNELIRSASGDLPLSAEQMGTLRHFAADNNVSALDAAKRLQWRYPELRDEGQMSGAGGPFHRGLMAAIEQVRNVGRGRMYEVNINARPEQFLDWDKPVGQQGEYVLSKLGPVFDPALSGREAYQSLVAYRPGQGGGMTSAGVKLGPDPREASGRLNATGIPGIKYLDQGSRAAGDGSRNYVVFDDSLIDILRKYGLAGLSVLPPATAAALSQRIVPVDHDPFAQPAAPTQ